ncbi:hypothetical protein C8Q72DRAFT_821170 [Fomitopsis betulina]|nr:hypothetical protein C8Q72DRAFT_821170 [Fomitopsis betulina]
MLCSCVNVTTEMQHCGRSFLCRLSDPCAMCAVPKFLHMARSSPSITFMRSSFLYSIQSKPGHEAHAKRRWWHVAGVSTTTRCSKSPIGNVALCSPIHSFIMVSSILILARISPHCPSCLNILSRIQVLMAMTPRTSRSHISVSRYASSNHHLRACNDGKRTQSRAVPVKGLMCQCTIDTGHSSKRESSSFFGTLPQISVPINVVRQIAASKGHALFVS